MGYRMDNAFPELSDADSRCAPCTLRTLRADPRSYVVSQRTYS